jgi:hypothetical protein
MAKVVHPVQAKNRISLFLRKAGVGGESRGQLECVASSPLLCEYV